MDELLALHATRLTEDFSPAYLEDLKKKGIAFGKKGRSVVRDVAGIVAIGGAAVVALKMLGDRKQRIAEEDARKKQVAKGKKKK